MEIVNLSHDVDAILHKRTQSESRYDARTAEMLLELLHAMRRNSEGSRLYASFVYQRELRLQYRAPNGRSCMITVTIDRPDYGPLENGLPIFHYRMAYRISGRYGEQERPLIEARVRGADLAVEFVQTAVSESRNTE